MLRRFLCLSLSGGSTFLFSVSEDSKNRVRRRRWWRWPLRVCVVLLLVVAGAALYLNQAGLPDFVKRSLQARLAKRGVQLDFDWLRMDWNGAWQAGQLRFGQTDTNGSVAVTVGGSVVLPDYGALFSGRADVRELSLKGLHFDAQLADAGTNLPPIQVSWPQGELRLTDTGTLNAKHLIGDIMGVSVDIDLSVANARSPLAARDPRAMPYDARGLSEKLKPLKTRLAGLAKRREVVRFRAQPSQPRCSVSYTYNGAKTAFNSGTFLG